MTRSIKRKRKKKLEAASDPTITYRETTTLEALKKVLLVNHSRPDTPSSVGHHFNIIKKQN